MSKSLPLIFRSLVVVSGMFMSPSVRAQSAPPVASPEGVPVQATTEEIPAELVDPAFDRYVDLKLLRKGLTSQDAALLCDVALQMAEGERVLLRTHRGITGEKLLSLAIRLAAENRDTATIQRLTKVVAAKENKELSAVLELATKTSRAPRALSGLTIAIDQGNPETLVLFQAFVDTIRMSKLLADRGNLDEIAEDVKSSQVFDEKLKAHLLKLIADAKTSMPDQPDAHAEVLSKLMADTRDDNKSDVQASIRNGWKGVIYGKHFDYAYYATLIADLAGVGGGASAAWIPGWIKDVMSYLGQAKEVYDLLIQVVKQRKAISKGGRTVDCGIATYNHWTYIKIGGIKKKVSGPNTFQPYIRWK